MGHCLTSGWESRSYVGSQSHVRNLGEAPRVSVRVLLTSPRVAEPTMDGLKRGLFVSFVYIDWILLEFLLF